MDGFKKVVLFLKVIVCLLAQQRFDISVWKEVHIFYAIYAITKQC